MNVSPRTFFLATAAVMFLYGCSDPTNPWFREPDYSTVPALPDTTQAERVLVGDNGLVYYIVGEGSGKWTVQGRDVIRLFLTLRTESGEVLQSTYADGWESPESMSVVNLPTEGLHDGVVGMKEGAVRVIVVPPALGFGNATQSSRFFQFRDSTLVYDVELVEIL